jgi:uncharacterized protein
MMKERLFDPRQLDIAAFARAGAHLEGRVEPRELERLQQSLPTLPGDVEPPAAVVWSADGELHPVRAGPPEVWLHLHIATTVRLQCQRCLLPLAEPIGIDRRLMFVRDEAEAARLDEAIDEDVLVLSRRFDLHELIEDELILALPLVPRHEQCPQPLATSGAVPDDGADERVNPFAGLKTLRGGDGGRG